MDRLATWLCALTLLFTTPAAAAVAVDFETPASFSAFSFSNGAEFPGASGSFAAGPGAKGRGGWLRFDFACTGDRCGQYVAAAWTPPEPLPATSDSYLTFDYLPSEEAKLVIRLVDQTGQTFQWPLKSATIEAPSERGWRRLTLPLKLEGGERWGGAGDGKIHGGIRQVSFMAVSQGGARRGAVAIDDIALVDTAAAAAFRLRAAHPRIRETHIEAPNLGVAAHRPDDPGGLSAARAAGARYVRIAHWRRAIERPAGGFDHLVYDGLVGGIEAKGMKPIFILDPGEGPLSDPARAEAYADYVRAVAQRYKGRGVIYEVFNETDARGVPAAVFAGAVLLTIRTARAVDPQAQIVSGGLSWADPAYIAEFGRVLAQEPDLAKQLAGFGVHLYNAGAFEAAVADIAATRAILRQTVGAPPPLWVTEWGVSSTLTTADRDGHADIARHRQAIGLPRIFLTLWAAGVTEGVWYDLHDDGPDPRAHEHNFGLLDQAGNPKPAHVAMRAFAEIARGRVYAGPLQDLPPLTHGLRLEGRGGDVVVLWHTAAGGGVDVKVSPAEYAAFRTAFGEERALTGSELVTLRLTEAEGPLYLFAR